MVFRGLVKDWPAVRAGADPATLAAYLKRFDRGAALGALFGPPGIGGRFHYNADLSGFNFRQGQVKLSANSDDLIALIEGRLSVPTAWATGKLKIDASMLDLLKLRSLL